MFEFSEIILGDKFVFSQYLTYFQNFSLKSLVKLEKFHVDYRKIPCRLIYVLGG